MTHITHITCPHCNDTYPTFDAAHVCSKGPYAPKLKPKMNERIKQLWEQAEEEIQAEYEDESRRNRRLYNEIFLPKFAELIVAECLRQVEEQYKPVLEDEIMMKDTHWDGYVQCGVDSYVAIREHFFGVEE